MKCSRIVLACLLTVAIVGSGYADSTCDYSHDLKKPFVQYTRHTLLACGLLLDSGPPPFEKFAQGQLSDTFRRAMNLSDRVRVLPNETREGPMGFTNHWLIVDKVRGRAFSVSFQHNHPTTLESVYELALIRGDTVAKAVREGREIRLQHAYVDGPINLNQQNLDFQRPISLIKTVVDGDMMMRGSFSAGVDFSSSTFRHHLRFYQVKFSKGVTFQGARFFGQTQFIQTDFFDLADFSFSTFVGPAIFMSDNFQQALFTSAFFLGKVAFTDSTTFRKEATFTSTKFKANSQFSNTLFYALANFRRAQFSGETIFRGSRFKANAIFSNAKFFNTVDFRETLFEGVGFFTSAEMTGNNVDFTSARFKKDARFTFASFSNRKNVNSSEISQRPYVSFRGTQFAGIADFAYAEFRNVDFSSYVPVKNKMLVRVESTFQNILDRGELSDVLRTELTTKIPLSQKTKILVVEDGHKWILVDERFRQTFAIFKEGKKLAIYLKRRRTWIDTFNLTGSRYQQMIINPQNIHQFAFDESAFYQFIRNQKHLEQPAFEYQNVTLAFKRFQREQQSFFLTRWFERIFLDWTTRYGTAKEPWGLLIYVGICVSGFTVFYLFNRNFLMFVRADGSIDENRDPPNSLEIFWFSLNTFVPAVEFFNATNWRPRYDVKFYGGFVRYSTLATIERILGWAMVPALLSYL